MIPRMRCMYRLRIMILTKVVHGRERGGGKKVVTVHVLFIPTSLIFRTSLANCFEILPFYGGLLQFFLFFEFGKKIINAFLVF